jgi:GAF domain-containing protein/class 3 adenylate cyclase
MTASSYNPVSHGYHSQILALDTFIEEAISVGRVQGLVRLNTYLRRYISPLVVRNLFYHRQLPLLLYQNEIDSIVALILDIRGFVNKTRSTEQSGEGLNLVAKLLQNFFAKTIRVGFENYGIVGEFAGDRVLIAFGFPADMEGAESQSSALDKSARNVQSAINTALAIQQLSEEIREDPTLPESLRSFEVGIGICANGSAWIGDIGGLRSENQDFWRHELTVISTAVNIAARIEEMTKIDDLLVADPKRKILVDESIVEQIRTIADDDTYTIRDLGMKNIRGIEDQIHLYHFIDMRPHVLPKAETIKKTDQELVDWICTYIDGAIERSALNKIQTSIYDVSNIVASATTLDEVSMFEQIMEQIIASFGAQKVTLYRVDSHNAELEVVASKGSQPLFEQGRRIPLAIGIAGSVARTGEAYISVDVHKDEMWGGRQQDTSIHSMMCVPLIVDRLPIGVIQVMDDRIGVFTQTDLTSLKAFAGIATIALENARHYHQALRMTKARSIMTDALTAQTLDEVLHGVMEAVRVSLEAKNATLYLVDYETGDLVFQKVISESQNPPKLGVHLPSGSGIVGQVVESKMPLLVPDTSQVAGWRRDIGSDIRSMICVPIISRNQVLGAIQVLERRPGAFTDEDLGMLRWLSASAAIAINDAVQLDQTRRRLIASEAMAGLGAIAGKLAHNLKNNITGIKTSAQYLNVNDDDKDLVKDIIDAADEALDEVKDFMRPLTEGNVEDINVDTIVIELIDEILRRRQERYQSIKTSCIIEITHQLTAAPPFIFAEKDQVQYIFRNLIDNAIRSIEDKGENFGSIRVFSANEHRYVTYFIEDTGTGIKPENLARIFKSSFTTRPEGTLGGYGLFWVQLTVERLGGRISVKSDDGVGSVFSIRFPLSNPQ